MGELFFVKGAMTSKMIPVEVLEFHEGGNTLWIHGPEGGTVLRLKTTGKITSKKCATSPISHVDIMVEGDIEICIGKKRKKGTPKT